MEKCDFLGGGFCFLLEFFCFLLSLRAWFPLHWVGDWFPARTACVFDFLLALRAHEKLRKRTKALIGSKITENVPKWVFFLGGCVWGGGGGIFPCRWAAEK